MHWLRKRTPKTPPRPSEQAPGATLPNAARLAAVFPSLAPWKSRTGTLAVLLAALLATVPAAWADCPPAQLTPLQAIKGIGRPAIPADQHVTVEGTVSGVFLGEDRLGGFYIQSEGPAAPIGIFVYAPRVPSAYARLIEPGNHLQITARTGRFREQIQLEQVQALRLCRRGMPPQPLALHLYGAPPTPLARLEGLLITLPQVLTVSGNHELGRYGSLTLSTDGRLFRGRDAGPAATVLILDDGSYRASPWPTPYVDEAGTRRVGSTVDGVTGVLAYAFDAYRLHPTAAIRFRDDNPRPPPLPAPGERLRVAVFNVENYFVTVGARGARDLAALERQRGKLAAAIGGLQADILALIEIENDRRALADLVEQVADRTGIRYSLLDGPVDAGSDAIKVALIYRAERIQALGAATADNHPIHNRPPVAALFQHDSRADPLAVVAVHFKSKTRCPPSGDVDRGQGCWNELRTEQARRLAVFLDQLRRDYRTDRLLIAGDLNAYGDEDPVAVMRSAGYRDLIEEMLPPERRYTYVYRGESGYLDHVLVTPALRTEVEELRIWHINADEPAMLGYTFDQEAHGPYRASDHDPVVVDLRR